MELLEFLCHVTSPSTCRNNPKCPIRVWPALTVKDKLSAFYGAIHEKEFKKINIMHGNSYEGMKLMMFSQGEERRGSSPQNKHHHIPSRILAPDLSQHGPVSLRALWPLRLLCQPLDFHEWSECGLSLFPHFQGSMMLKAKVLCAAVVAHLEPCIAAHTKEGLSRGIHNLFVPEGWLLLCSLVFWSLYHAREWSWTWALCSNPEMEATEGFFSASSS